MTYRKPVNLMILATLLASPGLPGAAANGLDKPDGRAAFDTGHMRRAKYTWEFFENGRKTMTEVETFTRKR